MKGTIIVIAVFAAGCIAGWSGLADLSRLGKLGEEAPMYILYMLIFFVGISMGRQNLKNIFRSVHPGMFLLPVMTVAGSLVFSAAVSLLLARWNVVECLAVGSGMGYYSLSSVLISQYCKLPLGAQVAAELGTIALLSNIFRELFTLVAAPLLSRYFGPFATIASAGATAMDVCLPVILRTSGSNVLPAAILSGFLTDFSVPFLVSFFCSFV